MSSVSLQADAARRRATDRQRRLAPEPPVDPVVVEQVDRIVNALMGRRWVASPNGRNVLLVEPDGAIVAVRAVGRS